MTILCPEEFHAATEFAIQADSALDAAIRIAQKGDSVDRVKLEEKRCQGMKTLLACFGSRAFSDAADNRSPYLPDDSEIHFDGGRVRTVLDFKPSLPVRETFISADWSPYSFFFREEWIDPYTRQRLEIYDRCWYIFGDGRAQSVVDGFDENELEGLMEARDSKIMRTFRHEDAAKAKAGGVAMRETMRRRVGMCGGIIYHADYDKDGKRCPYGSWSTHT